MADNFKYIINASLKLNTGSLTKLLEDVKQVDRDIKAHFEKSSGGVRVPITVDKDISKFQGEVSRVVEGYNRGQAPSIKIPVQLDNKSITRLQDRISEIRKQLNSLSDEQARVSVNTSLVVAREEGEGVQKQVESIKPVIEVKVVANEKSISDIKTQIEAIKADIQANIVSAVQNNPEGMNIIGHHRGRRPTNSVGRTASNARQNPRINTNLDNQKKSVQNDINTTRGIIKSLQDEMKLELSVNQIQKRIQSIRDARESGAPKVQLRNAKGHFSGSLTSDQYDNQIKSLEDALKKHEQIEKLQKDLSDKEDRLTKLQQQNTTRSSRVSRQRPNKTWYDDVPLPSTRQVSEANRKSENKKYKTIKQLEAKRVQNPNTAMDLAWEEYNKRMGRVINPDTAHRYADPINKRITQSRQPVSFDDKYVGLNQQRTSLQSQISKIEDSIGGKSVKNRNQFSQSALDQISKHLDTLRGKVSELDKLIDEERAKVQAQTNKFNSTSNKYIGNRFNSIGNTQTDHDALVKKWINDEIQKNRVHDINTAHEQAYYDNIDMNRVHDPSKAYTQANRINNNMNKQSANANKQQQANDKEARRTQSVNQAMHEQQNHIRRWGVNGQYSADSMIDALKDPNVNLSDSKKILGQLNQYQAQQSRATGMNFQKSYAIKYLDENGSLHEVNSMVYQYTKLGEVIEKSDKGFVAMMDHITSKVGMFSMLEGGIVAITEALVSSINEMVQFNQQLAEIQSTTQNLNNTDLKPFYKPAGGSNQLQSQIQSNAFDIGKQFGVDTLNTVMPIQQAVIARPDLISSGGPNGKYDAQKQNEIVKNIMQFSAISTGGKEDEATVNELTNDLLSLYQANQTHNSKGYMGDMTNMLDYMSSMKSYGVNTTNITNAMAELAPETLQQGVDSNQAMALMGSFSLANAGGKPEDVENIGKTFYNSIMHANTNSKLKDTLSEQLGINLDANPMKTPDLINKIFEKLPMLEGNEAAQMQLAQALSSSGGGGSQSKAMTPLMVKFLEGSQNPMYKKFMTMGNDGSTQGAMDNAWAPYSKTLQTNIQQLVQSFKQLALLLGQLGVADFFGASIKGLTMLLNVLDSVLGGMQKMSAFFQDKGIFDFSKFTTSALMFLGTMKMIQKFFNAKQWGGYVGSFLASKNPWGYSLGIKQNSPVSSIGSTVASAGPTVVQEAEAVAPSVLPFAPMTSSGRPTVNAQEMNQMEKAVSSRNVNSILSDVMTFTTADMMVNDFKNNPATSRLISNVNNRVIPQTLSEMNVRNMPTPSRAFAQNVAKTAEYDALSTGQKMFSPTGVGNFMSQAVFMGQFKTLSAGTGEVTTFLGGLVNGFKSLAPILLDFGLLLTRLTVIGGALFLAFEGVKLVADQIAKDKANQTVETQSNINDLHSQIAKNPKIANNIQQNVDDLINYRKSAQSDIAESPLQKKYGVNSTDQNKGESNIQNLAKYGIQYHKTLNGKDYITYQTGADKKGKPEISTYHIGNTDDKKAFNDFLNNGMMTDTKKIADQWAINTSYLGDYSNQLKVVNTLTQNLTESMKQVDSANKAIDATFGGINSSDALQQKITITQQGLDKTKNQIGSVSDTMDTMNKNKDKLNSDYNSQKTKIIGSGVSQSSITDMETKLIATRADGSDPKSVIDGYKDPKLNDLAKAFNTLQDYTTTLDSSEGNYLSLKDQYEQMILQQKQYQAQLAVTKLGIDTMNASLQNLGTIASASKALVDMNANVLQTGDNSAQISALHGSMQVSNAQMDNMVGQKNTMQSKMAEIKKANPNEDFSLSALYNPSGEVTSEQLAYKTLYEQSQQMTQSISSQSSTMYEQVQQLRDLVLNSTEYADTWQRVQQTVQDVKDSIKSTNDFQYQMATVNDNSLTTAGATGQKFYDVRQQQLNSLRDSSLQLTTKLTTDKSSLSDDTSKLDKAWQDVLKQEGDNFQNAMINPLKDIVKGFTSSDSAFGSSVGNFKSAVDSFTNTVGQDKTNAQAQASALNSASQSGTTSSYGSASSTGQTIQTGQFSEKNYDSMLGPVAGGVLKDNIGAVVQAGAKYGVPPELIMAVAQAETSGTSNLATRYSNFGGIKASGSSPEWSGSSYSSSTGTYRTYDSPQQGLNDLAYVLSQKIQQGYNTIPLLNAHYAQSPYWMNTVASIMGKETGTSSSTWLGDATSNSGMHLAGNDGGDPNYTGVIGGSSPSSAVNSSNGGNGGVSGMFSWFNSVLNNKSAMSYSWGGAHVEENWNQFIQKAIADCSGLVEQVYKNFAGIDLGTTNSQHLYSDNNGGSVVSSKSQLQSGDLVFFGSGTNGISHVGVYAGNNQMYTIDHDGTPVTKEAMWSDYVGGKHFNLPNGVGSPTSSVPTQTDTLVQQTNSLHDTMTASTLSVQNTIPQMLAKLNDDIGQALVNGNIADVMGTSGITAQYDRITQERQNVGAQMISNKDQIDALNAKHDSIVEQMNNAYKSGDSSSYNEYHAQLAYTDGLIKALQDNTSQLQSLDASYKAIQQQDPRLNYDTANQAIAGGVNTLRLFNQRGQDFSVDYLRTVNEINTMHGEYDTHAKNTSAMQTLFDTFGMQAPELASAKRASDQDNINLIYTQLSSISDVLKNFAQGTQDWYSALETVVKTEQSLQQLEQTRLDNAKTNFELTGTGSSAYVQQQAYMNSKNYTNASTGLQDALNNYRSGVSGQLGYGISTGTFRDRASAVNENNLLMTKYGVGSNVVANPDGSYRLVSDNALSSSTVNQMSNDVSSKTQSQGLWTSTWANNDFGFTSAHTVANDLQQKYGTGFDVINPTGKAIGIKSTNQNLSQDELSQMESYVKSKYGLLSWSTGTGSQSTTLGGGNHGIWTSTWANNDSGFTSAHTVADAVKNQFGVGMDVINPTGKAIGLKSTQQNMSQDLVNQINAYLKSKFGLIAWSTGKDTNTSMDFNQQIANLQVIADAHNKMIQQMNDYKTAVTDGFKAGALSIDDYISKMNQLRDVQTEAKDNAINMLGNISSGFSSALSDALTQGMQGSINSPLDFMNSIKSTISSSVSGQLTNTLLNNTGLQDVMNKISSSVAKASTSGNPNDIVNMFNNNDFGKQMQDAIAPFLPMIQQIVGSTKGIFTILKDQVYNSPSGFKIDNYMNEIASRIGYQGIKTMNPNVNDVGSPTLNFPNGGQIQTTTPSQTPTGIPTSTSTPVNGTTTQTGAPENTVGSGTGAPSTSSFTSAPATSNKPWQSSPPVAPAPAPAPTNASATTGARNYVVQKGDNPWTIENKLKLPHGWLQSHNSGMNPNKLQIGQVLKYHTGGIAGIMNFQSAEGLKSNEVSAILQKAETVFQPNQLDDLVSGAFNTGAKSASNGSDVNINVTVNVEGGNGSDKQTIEDTVRLAVSQALSEFKKQQRLGNLSWKGTSY